MITAYFNMQEEWDTQEIIIQKKNVWTIKDSFRFLHSEFYSIFFQILTLRNQGTGFVKENYKIIGLEIVLRPVM